MIVSLLNSEDIDNGPVLTDVIDWCKLSFLDINVLKTIIPAWHHILTKNVQSECTVSHFG